MGDFKFKLFEVIKMADPLRYQNLKLIARWNGSLCLLVCVFSILACLVWAAQILFCKSVSG